MTAVTSASKYEAAHERRDTVIFMRPAENEGRLRSLLALAIVGCVGLAAWTGGCGRDTVVQPDASSSDDLGEGPDRPGGGGDEAGPQDLGGKDSVPNQDAQAGACCSGSESARCLNATDAISCDWRFDSPQACLDSPGLSSYGHVWYVHGCGEKGCNPSTGNCRP